MPRSPAKSLTSTAASPPDTSLDPPRDAEELRETSGIRAIRGNGTEVFHPWATIDQVRETTRAFHLLDLDGRVLAILPKRALDSPDLLPALRTFLKQAVAQQPPPAATAASAAADESQP